MNEVGFNREYKALKLRHDVLRERLASQVEMYTHLVGVVGPNIKANYMMLVGQLEHRVYELKIEANRWKRRFALRQQFLNRGETPDFVGIEIALKSEFAEYRAQIERHVAEIKKASLRINSASLSKEESSELRCTYLNAVKKLHPDLNPDLPRGAAELWNEIQKAYAECDWKTVRFLASIVDHVISGNVDFPQSSDGIAALKASCERLDAKCGDLARKTADLQSAVPFTWQELLEDDALLAERRGRLNAQIKVLEECVREYEERWKNGK